MRESALIPTTEVWQCITEIAPVAAASRLYGVDKGQAAMVMLTGYELGLGLVASFEFVHVIQGRPSISPKGALALIQNSPELAEMEIKDEVDGKGNPTACTVRMKRRNGMEYTTRYTMQDAARAGLIKPKGNWEKYPANMLRWRAVGYCADVVFPDLIGGLYRPEELGADVDAEGAPVITVEPTVLPPYSEDLDAKRQERQEPEAMAEHSRLTGGAANGELARHMRLEGTGSPEIPTPPPSETRTWPELRDAALQIERLDGKPYYKHQAHVVNALRLELPDWADVGFWDTSGVLNYPWEDLYGALVEHAQKGGEA